MGVVKRVRKDQVVVVVAQAKVAAAGNVAQVVRKERMVVVVRRTMGARRKGVVGFNA